MNTISCYFDGSCEPKNPGGVAKYGIVCYEGKEEIYTEHGIVCSGSEASNNVAEWVGFHSIIKWLIKFKDLFGQYDVNIYGDSMMVCSQARGYWRIKDGLYKKYALDAMNDFKDLDMDLNIEWIPREFNARADELSTMD